MVLEHEGITEQIIGALYEVHGVLGYGFAEAVYQKAMQVELIHRGLHTEIEYPVQVHFKGFVVGDYKADLMVDQKVIVELKIARSYVASDEAQLLNLLKATDVKVGLLVNFGREKAEFRRFVF